jgi:hypothetical protein
MANQLPLTDGNILAVGFIANVQPANVLYVVNSASLELPGESTIVTNANGVPTAARHFEGAIRTGTAEIQVNATADKGDIRGNYFTTDEFTNANVNCIILTQSAPIAKGTARVYTVGLVGKIN